MHVHLKRLSEGIYPVKVGRILRVSRGTPRRKTATAGFTLAELIIGFGLSMMVMAAVLSSYVFIARAYTTIVGFSEPNQPTFENQGRKTLDVLAADVQVASGVYVSTTSPVAALSATEMTLVVPRPNGGKKYVTYYYNDGTAIPPSYAAAVPAKALGRIDRSTSTTTVLHWSVQSFSFSFYDVFVDIDITGVARNYTTYANYLSGIKQLSVTLTAQSLAQSGTETSREYIVRSPRYVMRNKALLY